jgi:hypothetical protein
LKQWNAPKIVEAEARLEGPILQRAFDYTNATRNPKKLAAELSNKAGFSLDERAALEKKILEGRAARSSKIKTTGNDPLLVASALRPMKLKTLKALGTMMKMRS